MKHKIGFMTDMIPQKKNPDVGQKEKCLLSVKKSLADVYFPEDGRTLTYYNDQFNLKVGSIVFVDGKLERQPGFVRSLNYNFKIRPDDYRKVISVADTQVHGKLYIADSHYMTFDPHVLPREKVSGWFFPPDEEYVASVDDTSFSLNELLNAPFSGKIMEKGNDYFADNRVIYLTLDNGKGYAVVSGTHGYEVEFTCQDGIISQMTCTCPCCCNCKHQFAVLLQLRKTLKAIEKNYESEFEKSGYFAVMERDTLNSYALTTRDSGSIVL